MPAEPVSVLAVDLPGGFAVRARDAVAVQQLRLDPLPEVVSGLGRLSLRHGADCAVPVSRCSTSSRSLVVANGRTLITVSDVVGEFSEMVDSGTAVSV